MRLLKPIAAAFLLVACGSTTPSRDDAMTPGNDARPPTARYAEVVWERLVTTAQSELFRGLGTEGAIAILGAPYYYLYDPDGERTTEAARPDFGQGSDPRLRGALTTTAGDLAALYEKGVAEFVIQEQDWADLAAIRPPIDVGSGQAAALGEHNGQFHVLSLGGPPDYVLTLRNIVSGTVIDTRVVASDANYVPRGEGYTTDSGELLYCIVRDDPSCGDAYIARIDPASGALDKVLLTSGDAAGASGCRLFRGARSLLAIWEECSDGHRWALISLDGTSVLAEAPQGDTLGLFVADALHDGNQFVVLTTSVKDALLYAIDDLSAKLIEPPWTIRLKNGESMGNANAALAWDGENPYVGIIPTSSALEPDEFRLQKLEPLTP